MIIMQTKNHKWKFPYRVTRGHLSKISWFFGDITRKYLVPFPVCPFHTYPLCMLGGGRGKEPSLHPYNVTCVLYVCMYMIDEKMAVFTNASNFLSKVVFLSAPPES